MFSASADSINAKTISAIRRPGVGIRLGYGQKKSHPMVTASGIENTVKWLFEFQFVHVVLPAKNQLGSSLFFVNCHWYIF